jgi:hypothetical protein
MDLAGDIQDHMDLKIFWIPGQARNDKKSWTLVFLMVAQSRSQE